MSKKRKERPIVNLSLHAEMKKRLALEKEVKANGVGAVIRNRTGGIDFDDLKKRDPERAATLKPQVEMIIACAR